MTGLSASPAAPIRAPVDRPSLLAPSAAMRRRNAAETRFRLYGLAAIFVALATLAIMLFTVLRDGVSAFTQAQRHGQHARRHSGGRHQDGPHAPGQGIGMAVQRQGEPPEAAEGVDEHWKG